MPLPENLRARLVEVKEGGVTQAEALVLLRQIAELLLDLYDEDRRNDMQVIRLKRRLRDLRRVQ